MPALCLCYEVHEPYRLCRYTVFDMGQNSLYEDDDHNCDALLLTARTCYLPMNDLLLKLIRRHGKAFKVAFSISGTALDQFEQYAPEVVESFQALADTGNVEFVAETAPHSLAFLYSRDEFDIQVREQCERIKRLFGKKPTTFRNTEFVYNNDLPVALEKLGFKAVLAEGADHVLGWRSPNYVYRPISTPRMRLLLRNSSLSTDIGLRFNDQAGTSGRSRRKSTPPGATALPLRPKSSTSSTITIPSACAIPGSRAFSTLWKPCPPPCWPTRISTS